MGPHQAINIRHLISGDLWAGAEVQAYTLLKALKTEPGIRVSAVVLNEGKLSGLLRQQGIDVLVLDESRYGFWRLLALLRESLAGSGVDIIHSHRYKENILAAMMKREGLVRRLVQTVHGTEERFSGLSKLKMGFYWRLNRHFTRKYFDRILTVSHDIRERLAGTAAGDRMVTIHNGIDLMEVVPWRDAAEVRKELGIAGDSLVIGSAGRLVPVKGYEIFLQAAAQIAAEIPNAAFVLAGDGPCRPELEALAEQLGLSGKVKFLGFRDDIIDVINSLDLFVVSSYQEGIPMVVLEAMALCRPVVATGVGGIREIIASGSSGILVGPGSPSALAKACISTLRGPELGKQLGVSARARIEEEFSAGVLKKRVAGLYREVMNLK